MYKIVKSTNTNIWGGLNKQEKDLRMKSLEKWSIYYSFQIIWILEKPSVFIKMDLKKKTKNLLYGALVY